MAALFRLLLLELVPAALVAVGQTSFLQQWFPNGLFGLATDKLRDYATITGCILTFAISGVSVHIVSRKNDILRDQRDAALSFVRKTCTGLLGKATGQTGLQPVNIRIFVPCFRQPLRGKERYFRLVNMPGLCSAGTTTGLRFRVEPFDKAEGMVGLCYAERNITYDSNVQEHRHDYRLTNRQANATRETKFVLCVPLFDSRDRVDCIMSVDSPQKLEIIDEDYAQETFTVMAEELRKCLANIMKGGVMR